MTWNFEHTAQAALGGGGTREGRNAQNKDLDKEWR